MYSLTLEHPNTFIVQTKLFEGLVYSELLPVFVLTDQFTL